MNTEQIAYLAALAANMILWLGQGCLPGDKRVKGILLIALTLLFYGVAGAATGQTWGEMVALARLIEALLGAAGINLAADVALMPNGRLGMQVRRGWRWRFGSIVR